MMCTGNGVTVFGAPFPSLHHHTSWLAGCSELYLGSVSNCHLLLCTTQIAVHTRHLGRFKYCLVSMDGGSLPRECCYCCWSLISPGKLLTFSLVPVVVLLKEARTATFGRKMIPVVLLWSSFAGSWHWGTAFVEADGLGLVSSSSSATNRDTTCRWAAPCSHSCPRDQGDILGFWILYIDIKGCHGHWCVQMIACQYFDNFNILIYVLIRALMGSSVWK